MSINTLSELNLSESADDQNDASDDNRVPGVSLEVAWVTGHTHETLPVFNVYQAACECAQATVERLIEE